MRCSNRHTCVGTIAALLLASFLGGCDRGDDLGLPPTTKAYRSTRCWFDAPAHVRVVCGLVTVPETPGSSAMIQIAVARFLSATRAVEPDPVVFLTGGPGQDAATIAADAYDGLARAAGARDIVAIDQRGTGKSDPNLSCAELRSPAYASQPLVALERCRERIVAGGHDPASFHTATVSDDIEAVRVALGYDTWNLVGFSYGTRLALTVARDHPEGVRSMVLSSVVPLEADILDDVAANAERSFERVFSTCAADSACAAAYPNLEATFRAAVSDLDANPATVVVRTKQYSLRGSDVVEILFQVLYDSSSIPYLPSLIDDAANGDFSVYGRILGALLTGDALISDGMHLSVQCADELPFSALGTPNPAVDPLFSDVFSDATYADQCAVWNVPASPSAENEPVVTAIPTLTIAGGFDPITPPAYADLVAASLTDASQAYFPGGGHSIGLSDGCSQSIIASFLGALGVDAATTACAAAAFPVAYETPGKTTRYATTPLDDAAVDAIVDRLRRRLR